MPKIDPATIGACATQLSIVSQLFNTRMAGLLDAHGMTVGQFSILNHILRPDLKNGSRISEIATAVEVGQPAVTKAITKFEILGLVKIVHETSDKRAKQIIPLPAAHVLLGEIRTSIGPDLAQAFGTIGANNIPEFTAHLRTLAHWLDENRLKP